MNCRACVCPLGFLGLVFVLVAAPWQCDRLPVLLAQAGAQEEAAEPGPAPTVTREEPVSSEGAKRALIVLVLLSGIAVAACATMILMGRSFQERVGPRLPG